MTDMEPKPVRIGVLALQGGIEEHLAALAALPGVTAERFVDSRKLDAFDGVVLPGGESTTMGKLLVDFGLLEPLRARIAAGMPVWGTCAGAILLAKGIDNDGRRHLQAMDITVSRNAYGRQVASFVATGEVAGIPDFPMVFVRAPVIISKGPDVATLAVHRGSIVAARERNMVVTTFHPELTDDRRFHAWFVDAVVRAEH